MVRDYLYSRFLSSISFFVFSLLLTAYCLLSPFVYAANPSQVCFNNKCVTVEVADNDAARIRGLQGRFHLDPNSGMLFVFPQQDLYNFWMKDTLIPLDIIWLDSDQKIVDIKVNVPPCQENPCPMVVPSGTALYVLEINAGAALTFGIHAGDTAVLK